MKKLLIVFLILILSACVHITKIGFLVIKNETGQILEGKTRFEGENKLVDDFSIQPGHDAILEKYDIAPGTEGKVLASFAEVELKKNDCVINLKNDKIKKNASFEGVSVLVHIKPDLFTSCAK